MIQYWFRGSENLQRGKMASPPSILVPDEEEEIKAWLQEHGFNGKDGYRDWKEEKNPQARLGKMKGPMKLACSLGEVNVCKWLFEVGASVVIDRMEHGNTPMHSACGKGHLPMCKWLYEVGAAADITKADSNGSTPMFVACEDGQLPVCKWLVFKGALNLPAPADHDNGHVDQAIVERDTSATNLRPKLLAWAQDLAANHHTFLHVVLRASVVLPHRRMSPRRRCYLPMVPRCELERIGSFLDLEIGRRVRNVREFAAALMMAPEVEEEEEEDFLDDGILLKDL